MNKLIALLLVFALTFSLCACGSSGKTDAWYAMWVAEACGVAFALTSLLRQLRKKVRTLEKTAALR